MSGFDALLFDGRTAKAHPAELRIENGEFIVTCDAVVTDRVPVRDARISERFLAAPRMVELARGASLQVGDADGAFDAALRDAGIGPGRVERLQTHAWGAAVSVVGIALIAGWVYLFGIPMAATSIADRISPVYEARIGESILASADDGYFHQSTLPPARQDELRARFGAAAARAAPQVDYTLVFRSRPGWENVNALTLPGGTIVMLDGLDDVADDDDALVGVFAHELGHVARRHTLRQFIQASGVAVITAALWGDFSALAAQSATVLGTLDYARDMETEADDFAVMVLRVNDIPLQPLLRFLHKMEADAKGPPQDVPGILLTHPLTAERIAHMRRTYAGPSARR